MTKPVHADPRRREGGEGLGFAPALGAGAALELPVLFQLSDLSQGRILSPARLEPKPAPREAESSAAAAIETKSVQETSSASAEKSAAETSSAKLKTEDKSPPADSPTIRQRAQMRERRQQAAAQGDWFQTQGKYILVVFLLGLIVTIFLARGKDDSPQSPIRQPIESDVATEAESPAEDMHSPVDPPSMAEQMDIAPAEGRPAIATAEISSDPLADVNPAHGDDSVNDFVEPAPPAGAPRGPQVTLQPPQAAAPSAAAPPAAAPSEGESLFPWSSEPRIASRPQPEPSGAGTPLPQANPHYPGPPAASPPPGDTDATPTGYPVTDPSTYRGYQSPTAPPATSGAAPILHGRRVPTAPRPSGPRYERTGSGLY